MRRHIHPDRLSSGNSAAELVAKILRTSIRDRGRANLLVATGTSQFAVLGQLTQSPGVRWDHVHLFHLDEYVGLAASHPASFRHYLQERFVKQLPMAPRSFLELRGENPIHCELSRLSQAIPDEMFDVAIIGIGENGHIAFNDPPANFETTDPFLLVELDAACRQQQVSEGWFPSLDSVPRYAITMSLDRILRSRQIVCVVPEKRKAEAVKNALEGPLTPFVPASILRTHPSVDLFLDCDSASLLFKSPRGRQYASAVVDERQGQFEPTHGKLSLDLQLNGYRGIDFNADQLSIESIRSACELIRQDQGGQFLATIITDSIDKMTARVARLASAIEADELVRETMLGIHVEGPFLNPEPGFRGAHPANAIVPASLALAERLVEAGRNYVKIVTLAPECDKQLQTTRWLVDQQITVSAGHCNPPFELLQQAIEAGITLFTHLGNGCPLLLPRHDNIIQRVLAATGLSFVTLIADGIHIPYQVLSNYLRIIGIERSIIITDGTSAAGMGPGTYTLAGQQVVIDKSGAAWAPDRSHLLGSATTMARTRAALAAALKLSEEEIDQVTVRNPRRVLGRTTIDYDY